MTAFVICVGSSLLSKTTDVTFVNNTSYFISNLSLTFLPQIMKLSENSSSSLLIHMVKFLLKIFALGHMDSSHDL